MSHPQTFDFDPGSNRIPYRSVIAVFVVIRNVDERVFTAKVSVVTRDGSITQMTVASSTPEKAVTERFVIIEALDVMTTMVDAYKRQNNPTGDFGLISLYNHFGSFNFEVETVKFL